MYTFLKCKDRTNKFDITSISMSVDGVVVTDIVSEFRYFLLASGFAESSIKDAFQEVAYEMNSSEDIDEEE